MCPVTQLSPFPVELEYPEQVAGVPMGFYLEWMRSCSRITSTLCPAISVPAGFTPAGLPVGLQIVSRPFAELELLQLAHALEASWDSHSACRRYVGPCKQSDSSPETNIKSGNSASDALHRIRIRKDANVFQASK